MENTVLDKSFGKTWSGTNRLKNMSLGEQSGGCFDGFVVFLSEYLKIFREIYWSDLRRRAMIRATKEISRSTNHWKDSWMVRLGPKRFAFF